MNRRDRERKSLRIHWLNDSIFHDSGSLNWYQIIGKTVAFMGFFLLIYAVALYFIRDQYQAMGQWVVEHLGLVGVALFTFATGMFSVPVSVDIIFPFVTQWPPVPLLLTMSLASALGGMSGYWIGRLVGHLPVINLLTSRFSRDTGLLVNRYGMWAVVLAGFTPIPFSTVCWAAGMVKVKFILVALASLSRLPRMILYYLVIRGGLWILL